MINLKVQGFGVTMSNLYNEFDVADRQTIPVGSVVAVQWDAEHDGLLIVSNGVVTLKNILVENIDILQTC